MKVPEQELKVVESFKRRVQELHPGELVSLTVFGSKARGNATMESDIDLLAVIRSEDWRLGDQIRDVGYDLEVKHGVVLSIQVISQSRHDGLKAAGSQFLDAVEAEGLVV